MIQIPIEHFETEKDGAKFVRSVFRLQIETEVKTLSTDQVKKYNVERLAHILKTAGLVKG